MADTIHKNKKDYPHFDKFYVGSPSYAEGYERIFGKGKNGKKGKKLQKQESLQKVARVRTYSQSISRQDSGENSREES